MAEEALSAAEDRVEEASEAIDTMQDDVSALQSEQRQLRQQLDATVRKQVELWEQQLASQRERLTRLPSDAEQRLGPELEALSRQVEELSATLDSYASAAADSEPGLRQDVEDAVSELRTSFEEFEQSLAAESR